MNRFFCFFTVAAALAACGDDTGGNGGSGTAGGGQGGDDAATTASTTSGGEGGGDGGGTTSSVTGGGGADTFPELIAACEDLDTALNDAATEAGLDCGSVETDCEGLPGQVPGCEAETEALVVCQAETFDPAECICDGADLDCGIFFICSDELDAFLTCRDSG